MVDRVRTKSEIAIETAQRAPRRIGAATGLGAACAHAFADAVAQVVIGDIDVVHMPHMVDEHQSESQVDTLDGRPHR